jgi:exopolysaccharide biosynthesis polyprenyl glycosylphosphotransferase
MRKLIASLLHWPVTAVIDIVLINAGYLFAFTVLWRHLVAPQDNFHAYSHLVPMICSATLAIFYLSDLYGQWVRWSVAHTVYSIFLAISMTSISTIAIGFWSREFAFPRSVFVIAAMAHLVLIVGYRYTLRQLHHRLLGHRKTIVIGDDTEDAYTVAERLHASCRQLFSIQGCVSRCGAEEVLRLHPETETVVMTAKCENRNDIVRYCVWNHLELLAAPNLPELLFFGAESIGIGDLLLFSIGQKKVNPAQALLKRMIDFAGASLLILITSPVLLVLWIIIPLLSDGPAFFRQERVGKKGKKFEILKFRTMVSDAEKLTGPVLSVDRDPRITGLGAFLRATRLDELPQLINVVRGEMSIVGPRPERPFFVNQFEAEMPAYALRHSVRPGITGLAQVMGCYSTTPERKLQFDLLYIYNRSLVIDFKILFKTAQVVLQREQAAGLKAKSSCPDRQSCAHRSAACFDAESCPLVGTIYETQSVGD